MDINSILSSYSVLPTSDVTSKSSAVSQKSSQNVLERDTYSAGSRKLMSSDMYDYSTKLMSIAKMKNEVDAVDTSSAEEPESASGSGGGGESSDGEAKTEVETKVINGQVYMIITTTDEEGNVTIEQVKVGGDNENGEKKTDEGNSSLEDMITM